MALHLAEGLRAAGDEVLAICRPDGEGWLSAKFAERGFDREWLGLRGAIDRRALGTLRRILRDCEIDLLHAHDFTTGIYGAVACRLERRPHVITLHGGAYYAGRLQRKIAFRWAIRTSRATVGVSDATAREAEELLRLRPGSVGVVPNGIDFPTGDRERARAALGLRGDAEVMILAVGNLYPVKGHRFLIDALASLARLRPELLWRAAIAGRGGEESDLRRRLSETGLGDRIALLGFRSDISDLLAAADVYVMPSLSEGLPIALVEALLSRTAVVASRVGGIPEVVEDGRSALLVPPEDSSALATALERVVVDASIRERLAAEGLSVARERFSLDRMVSAYRELYRG